MTRYHLNLEVGSDGSCMAHVAELPGCFAIGATREEAIARSREAVAGYVEWLRSHGEPVGDGEIEVEAAQEAPVEGHFPGTPGDHVARFESDMGTVTDEEIGRALRWLGWSRAELEEMFAEVPYEELDWGPPGETATMRSILQHVASAEAWYLKNLEAGVAHQLPTTLETVRRWAQRRLREMTREERGALRLHDGEEWTARKVLRRFLEHEREHSGQLREMMAKKEEGRRKEEGGGQCRCFPEHWTEVASYERWRVFLNWNQDYLGRCFIALGRHEEDLLALTADEREDLWRTAARLREALRRLLAPDHWNYQVLGNATRHLHMHVTPRYRESREFGGERFVDEHWGTWPHPSEAARPEATVRALAEALRRELA